MVLKLLMHIYIFINLDVCICMWCCNACREFLRCAATTKGREKLSLDEKRDERKGREEETEEEGIKITLG